MDGLDTGILDVMMTTFSGSKDEYGHDTVPPLPLAFDRVNEGRSPTSKSSLFTLPFELLGTILRHIPHDSLAALASVNTDCRQLARSRQFASIQLNYSNSSVSIAKKLMGEAVERGTNGGLTRSPSLGACVRRITIATTPGCVNSRHGLAFQSLEELDETERNKRLKAASCAFFDVYIPSIQAALPSSVPHLELLD